MKILLPLLLLVGLTATALYFIGGETKQEASNTDMLQLGDFAFQEKRYEDAFLWFNKAALQGLSQGQYRLSQMHQRGQGTDKNDSLALRWMRAAAQQGLARAEYEYATMLEFGRGLPQANLEQAMTWYEKAAQHRYPEAMLKLAKYYFEHKTTNDDVYQSLDWAIAAEDFNTTKTDATLIHKQINEYIIDNAQKGNAADQYKLANMYSKGFGITQDLKKANLWLLQSAQQNFVPAQYELGISLAINTNTKEGALHWLTLAAKNGHAQAGYAFAALLAQEDATHQAATTENYQQAWRWLYDGMRNNDAKVLYNLATTLKTGLLGLPQTDYNYASWLTTAANAGLSPAQNDLGIYTVLKEQNSKASLPWFIKAAESGNAKAQFNLGLLFARGQGITPNDDKALQWWQLAEKNGNTHASKMLGLLYNLGRGVGRSEAEAIKWYEQAAQTNDTDALYNLAILYFNGRGVELNYAKSAQYLKTLALDNDAEAQNLYASLFLEGKGVAFSPPTAITWFQRAANQGNVNAMFNLASQYRSGNGVPQDDKKALYWYKQAAQANFAAAQNAVGYMYAEGRGTKKDKSLAEEWFLKASDNGLSMAGMNMNALKQHNSFSLVTLQINDNIRADTLTNKNLNLSDYLQANQQPIL